MATASNPLATLPSLGPKSVAMLARAGIVTLAQFQAAEPVALYLRLKALWPGASLNLLYALVAAQEGRDWREVARERRSELLLQIDMLQRQPR